MTFDIAPSEAARPPPAPAPVAEPRVGRFARLGKFASPVVWCVLPLIAFSFKAAGFGRWIIDDAAISFAYARSIAEGHGVVQQAGAPPVEGYSNPLWTALLALLRLVGVFDNGHVVAGIPDYVLVPKILGVVCTAGVLVAYRLMFATVLDRWPAVFATAVAGLALAANPSYVGWAVSGLENPLYALLVAVLAAILTRALVGGRLLSPRVAVAASVVALAAAATRPDGVVYACAYPLLVLALVRRHGVGRPVRSIAVAVAVFCVPAAALLLLRFRTFGLWVPNTAVAKGQSGPDIAGLGKVFDLGAFVTWPVVVVAAAVVVLACSSLPWRTPSSQESVDVADGKPLIPTPHRHGNPFFVGMLGPLVLVGLAVGAFAVEEPGTFIGYRYATPVWVAGSAVLGAALVHLLAQGRIWMRVVVAVVALAAAVLAYPNLSAAYLHFYAKTSVPLCFVAERSRQYNTLADLLGVRAGSILLPDIGGTLMTSRLTVYDLAGLSDRSIADALARDDPRALTDYVFDTVRPTFIHVHGLWRWQLTSDPRLAADYVAVVPNQDFVRRDVISAQPDPGAATRFMAAQTRRLNSWAARSRHASCGPSLTVGSPSAIPD
ncbi:MAG TPA: hypothetical protein VE287_00825 [Actinopolymorphaceae bacterium]|nr:hypothetical protein [Actinopolymorphaceae bacterium]